MGRNNDTFTLIINTTKDSWGKYRRALRKEDQEVFDELWRAPKLHLAASAFLASEMPMDVILMSMLLEQYKLIKRLESEIERLKQSAVAQENTAVMPHIPEG